MPEGCNTKEVLKKIKANTREIFLAVALGNLIHLSLFPQLVHSIKNKNSDKKMIRLLTSWSQDKG